MRYALLLVFLFACDVVGTTDTEPPAEQLCPLLCDGTCPPECVPSACGTIGDPCDPVLGDQQCGNVAAAGGVVIRMACIPGEPWAVCAAPCSATEPCARGSCDLNRGACVDDQGVLETPIACDP